MVLVGCHLKSKSTFVLISVYSKLPALRLDSPTDFSEDDNEDEPAECGHKDEEEGRYKASSAFCLYRSEETCSQDSGLGMENDRVSWEGKHSVRRRFEGQAGAH